MTSLQDWIGKSEEMADVLVPSPAQRMAVTLNRSDVFVEGTPLPPAWHWLYFLPTVRLDATGEDGHARRGGFLPPITLPRRMWASSRIALQRELRIGERVLKKSTIVDVTEKQGKSGSLVFVRIQHEIIGESGLALVEEQDIVYREAPTKDSSPAPAQPAPAQAKWSRTITPDPVLLFRYSALTFNSHRIHYDRAYCLDVEGYPGLVVHGPLTASLLLESLREHALNRPVEAFSFRAVSPLYDTQPFRVEGRIDGETAQLWALNHEGNLAMTATATLT